MQLTTTSPPANLVIAAQPSGTPLVSEYVYPSGAAGDISPDFNSSGVPANPPPATQAITAGIYTQYAAFGFVAVGSSPAGIPIDWYTDGVLQYSDVLSVGDYPNEGEGFFGVNEWTAGTHTIYAIIGGVKTNTVTVTAS